MATQKKTWTEPKLTIFGSVEALTLKEKRLGTTDGFTFNGLAISG